ncbi:Tat pathway signal sequence domain protein [Kitasatospora sp. NPDC088134]|uniref:Tat pathway signal sequence domain protein n=1 Tax=Kitasatospora sp. NPDC088134 TaxID=3364071 RepID=UPI00383012F3
MRNRLYAGAAAVAAATALLALTTSPAGATGTPVLTIAGTSTAVAVGDSLSAGLVSGTLATMYNPGTTTGVKCTVSTIGGTVSSNPTAPGTASGPVSTLTFSGCTSNVVGVTGVNSLTMTNLPYTLSISDAAGFPVSLTAASGSVQAAVNLKTLAGNAICTYKSTSGSLNGSATNTPPKITMSNQNFTKLTGPSICFASIDFSAAYGPVTDTTLGGTVFVN